MAYEPKKYNEMAAKRHKPEEIVAKLRQVDVLVSQGKSVADAVRNIGVTEVTYYRWRHEFGGLKSDQVKRMKDCFWQAVKHRIKRWAERAASMQLPSQMTLIGFHLAATAIPIQR